MGTIVVLVMLAVAWTWYLVTWLRGRNEHRNVNSISSFSKHLSVLERTTPGAGAAPAPAPARPSAGPAPTAGATALAPVAAPAPGTASVPMTLSDAQRRRRNVLVALAAAAGMTLVAAVAVGGTLVWTVQLLVDALLVGFVVLLARSRALAVERAEKVHYLYEDEDGTWYEGWEDDESAWDEAAWDDSSWEDGSWDDQGWSEDGWDDEGGWAAYEEEQGYLLRSGS